MRKIQAIGNVTRDAEVRHLDGGRSVINFDLAINERWRDKNGEKQQRTHYVKCAKWTEASTVAQHILKGVKLYVEGTPEVDVYIGADGKAVGSVKIIVREFEFLSSSKKPEVPAQNPGNTDENSSMPTPDDDLPF